MVFSEVANTLDEINYNNRIEDFVLISARLLYYLHVANITSSLPTAYYSIMSFFLIFFLSVFPFFLSFFLFTFFSFETFKFYPPFFSANLKNFLGPMDLRSAILCSPGPGPLICHNVVFLPSEFCKISPQSLGNGISETLDSKIFRMSMPWTPRKLVHIWRSTRAFGTSTRGGGASKILNRGPPDITLRHCTVGIECYYFVLPPWADCL